MKLLHWRVSHFYKTTGTCNDVVALVGGSAWTRGVRHREQAPKGPLRRQVDRPTRNASIAHDTTPTNT